MEFGRLSVLDGVDWRLPGDAPATRRRPASAGPPARLRFACPVWSHPGFRGKLYPEAAAPGEFLRHYAEHFGAIELNTTWYGYDAARIRRWRDQTPEDFRFLPKLPKAISHDGRFSGVERETGRFCDALRELGPRLGPLWTILPPDFTPDETATLVAFVAAFPRDLRLAVELRHPRWFSEGRALEVVAEALEDRGHSLVLTDVAGRRDVLHQRLTGEVLLLRFAGHHLHPSDFERLDSWAGRLRGWATRGLREITFVFHQPEEHLAVELALHLAGRLGSLAPPPPRPRPQEDQGLLFS